MRMVGSGYQLGTLIGRGSTGEVWAGEASDDGRPVAVKILDAELAADLDAVARFVQEGQILTSVRSPHLVQVHDLIAGEDTLGIVMDLVRGPDLRTFTRQHGTLAPAAAAELIGQVLGALSVVHRAGIVHRDIKPENILIDLGEPERPRALLSDFGIAMATGDPAENGTGLAGTIPYLAPEIAQHGRASQASDLYSIGIVLHEMLSGATPFAAADPYEILRAHQEDRPAAIPGLAPPMQALLDGLLAKNPAARPPSAAAARQLLAQAAASVAAAPPLLPLPAPDGYRGPTIPPTGSVPIQPSSMDDAELTPIGVLAKAAVDAAAAEKVRAAQQARAAAARAAEAAAAQIRAEKIAAAEAAERAAAEAAAAQARAAAEAAALAAAASQPSALLRHSLQSPWRGPGSRTDSGTIIGLLTLPVRSFADEPSPVARPGSAGSAGSVAAAGSADLEDTGKLLRPIGVQGRPGIPTPPRGEPSRMQASIQPVAAAPRWRPLVVRSAPAPSWSESAHAPSWSESAYAPSWSEPAHAPSWSEPGSPEWPGGEDPRASYAPVDTDWWAGRDGDDAGDPYSFDDRPPYARLGANGGPPYPAATRESALGPDAGYGTRFGFGTGSSSLASLYGREGDPGQGAHGPGGMGLFDGGPGFEQPYDHPYVSAPSDPPLREKPQRNRWWLLPAGLGLAAVAGLVALVVILGMNDPVAPRTDKGAPAAALPEATVPIAMPPGAGSPSPSATPAPSASPSAAASATAKPTPSATAKATTPPKAALITMPKLTGRSLTAANAALSRRGLKPATSSLTCSGSKPEGQVLTQSPSAGTKVKASATVTVTVQADCGVVPNVVGMPLDDAVSALRAEGFTTLFRLTGGGGTVSDTDPVTAQFPLPGTSTTKDTQIYLRAQSTDPGTGGGGGTGPGGNG